jgi:hypothetical protein
VSYNGWKNYETWNVNLWLSNDQGTDNDVNDLARQAWEESAEWSGGYMDSRAADYAVKLGDAIEEYTKELPDVAAVLEGASMACDLLRAALSEVNWREIAEAWIDDPAEHFGTGDESDD